MAVGDPTLVIEESADAKSVFIKSDQSLAATTVLLQAQLDDSNTISSFVYTVDVNDNFAKGVTISVEDLGENSPAVFEDGIYTIYIKDSSNNILATGIEGFVAVSATKVMIDALDYRPSNDLQSRYIMEEKMRLLDNLQYSAQLGLTDAFMENLVALKKLV